MNFNQHTGIRLAIIEDEPVILRSLTSFFTNHEEFEVVFTARKAEDLIDKEGERPDIDILLLDIKLLGMSGIEGIPRILSLHPETNIVMLTTFDQDSYIFEALKAGAVGYLIKNTSIWEIEKAIKTIMRGGSFMSPSIARKVMRSFQGSNSAPQISTLTPRQNEILDALVEGLSYKMIADRMSISLHTTNDHIKAIYKKLHVNSKGEAINVALSMKRDQIKK